MAFPVAVVAAIFTIWIGVGVAFFVGLQCGY